MVPLSWYLALSAALFIIGTAGVLLRRNVLIVLLSLELMLNSVNINLVAFSNTLGDFRGQIIVVAGRQRLNSVAQGGGFAFGLVALRDVRVQRRLVGLGLGFEGV